MLRPAAGLALLALAAGCSVDSPPVPENSAIASSAPAATATPTIRTASPQPRESATSTPREPREPTMDADAAVRDVRRLAGDIGPREATSDNFAEAADLVHARFDRMGYDVRRTTVRVPAGNSWGTPVRSGKSANVIAEPAGFDPRKPHVVVGAHLDTVPPAPGAEDNASGIAVLLQLARMAAQQPAGLPVQFIAFGAEEPRGSGDAWHHFGSRQLLAGMAAAERRAVRAMVSLDRVGVRASYVPVCSANDSGNQLRAAIRAAGRRAEISTRSCLNRASDHWSYAKNGIPAVRLGSIPYAGYHSPRDVPSVVDRRQLGRVGRMMWAWLRNVE
jgi:hypothetical protein